MPHDWVTMPTVATVSPAVWLRCTPHFHNKRRDAVFAENEPDCSLSFVSLYSLPPQQLNPCFASEMNPVRFAETHVFASLPPLTKPSLQDAPSLCCRHNRPILAFVSSSVVLAKEEALAKQAFTCQRTGPTISIPPLHVQQKYQSTIAE